MDNAENVVAFDHRINDNPHRVDIVDLVESAPLHIDLAVDPVDALDAALDIGIGVLGFDPVEDPLLDAGQKLLPFLPRRKLAFNLLIGDRVEVAQGSILQLLLDAANAKPVGDGSIYLHRLKRFVAPLLIGQILKGTRVVQAVGQLDDDHPDVLRHSQKHLAQIFGLLLLF